MKFFSLCAILPFLLSWASASPPAKIKAAKSDAEIALPPTLTFEDFDEAVANKLTLVEFFSPYCYHCKELAPIWAEGYQISRKEQEELGIQMRQVDCVESGDLCERESISYYPYIRLYAPQLDDGSVPGKHVETFPRTLPRTAENFKNYIINAVAEFGDSFESLPSALKQIDIDLALKIVAGDIEQPYFIALFSSSNEQYDTSFPDSCLDCIEHRRNWDKLSNLVVTISRTGHINCHSHPTLCKKLGFPELANDSKTLSPRYIMFVPRSAGRIRFDYPSDIALDISRMKLFVTKLSLNYKYEDISANELQDLGVITPQLPESFGDFVFPPENKMALVYSYDKRTATAEDKTIMPYLLEMVTQLPFNIDLYASTSENLDTIVEKESVALVEYVNRDESFTKRTFDRKMFFSTSLTLKPSLYIYKANSLVPAVFQSFALEDMRMPDKIRKFVQKHMKPTFGELTPYNLKYYFNKRSSKSEETRDDKVAITFVNSDDRSHLEKTLQDISMVAHQYHLLKNEYFYSKLLAERGAKDFDVAKLKENNADSTKIIERMRKLIPNLFHRSDVAFTYVDIKQYPKLMDYCGLNIDGKEYVAGDTIVVGQSLVSYWDQNLTGSQLKSTPEEFREVLKHLLSPSLVSGRTTKSLSSKLVGSPYNKYLRAFDYIHQYGFFGYVLFMLTSYVIITVAKSRGRSRQPSAYNRKDGIIGVGYSKAD